MSVSLNLSGAFLGVGAPPPPPPVGTLVLVWPSTRYWPDTAAVGQSLASITGFPIGGAATVRLLAQPADVQPPADAVVADGANLRAGPGWAGMEPGAYILDVTVTLGALSKSSRTYVVKYSARAPDYSPADGAALATAISTVSAAIAANPGGFPGAVIELAPGVDYGDIACTFPKAGQTRKVVIRSGGADKLAGTPARAPSIIFDATMRVWVQNVALRGPERSLRVAFGGSNKVSEFPHLFRCTIKGGRAVWGPDGTLSLDPDGTTAGTERWVEDRTYIRGRVNGAGSFTQLDLRVGQDDSVQDGTAALGAWNVATVPGWVGHNVPGGLPGIVPLTALPSAGTGFVAEMEVQALTASTTPPKPAGGPDGNYVTRWRLVNGGSGYLVGSPPEPPRADSSVGWAGRTLCIDAMPVAWMSTTAGGCRNPLLVECDISDCQEGVRHTLIDETDAPWLFGNRMVRIYKDHRQFAFKRRAWTADAAHRMWFDRSFEPLSHTEDQFNPHADGWQGFDDAGGTGISRPFLDFVGNLFDAAQGRQGIQSMLISEVTAGGGYAVATVGNFLRGRMSNNLAVNHTDWHMSYMDTLLGSIGAASPGYAQSGGTVIWERGTYSNIRRPSTLARYLDMRQAGGSDATAYAAPSDAIMADWATARAAFGTIGAAANYGAFADPVQVIDHDNRVFDPNAVPARMLFGRRTAVEPGRTVVTQPRQLMNGSRPRTISGVEGVEWAKGATQIDALAAGYSSGPGQLEVGEYLALRMTAPAGRWQKQTGQLLLDGVPATLQILTKDSDTPGAGLVGDNYLSRPSVTGAGLCQRLVVAMSFVIPEGATGSFRLWQFGTTRRITWAPGNFSLFWDNSNTNVSVPVTWAFGTHNSFAFAIDCTAISPFTDPDSGEFDPIANGVFEAIANGLPVQPTRFSDNGGQAGSFTTSGGTRRFDLTGAAQTVMGGDVIAPAGFQLNWCGVRQLADGEPLPDLTDPAIIDLFCNDRIGLNGENWPGGLPTIFYRDSLANWNSAGGAVNRGTFVGAPPLTRIGSPFVDGNPPPAPPPPGSPQTPGVPVSRTRYTTGATGRTLWDVFSGVQVPDGHLALFVMGYDGASADLSLAGSDTLWTFHGQQAGTSDGIAAFSWFNGTGFTIPRSLSIASSAFETFEGYLYIIPRTGWTARLEAAVGFAAGASDPPALSLGLSRKVLALAATVTSGQVAAYTAPPAGFGQMQTSSSSGTSAGVRLAIAEAAIEAATINPGAFTPASSGGAGATIAIWEVLP